MKRRWLPLFFLALILSGGSASFLSAIAPGSADPPFLCVFQRGEQERQQGEFDKSIASFKEALAMATKTPDRAAETSCLMKLGLLYWNTGEIKVASDHYSQALAKAGLSGLSRSGEECRTALEIIRFYDLGKKCRDSSKNYRLSLKNFDKAIELSAKIKKEDFAAKCLRQKSFVYWDTNDFKNFRACTEEALSIARKIKHKKEEGRCLNNMGMSYWQSNDLSRALNFYQEVLQIAVQNNYAEDEADILSNIALVYWHLGDYNRTLCYQKRALKIDRQVGKKAKISNDLNNIGSALEKIGTLSNQKSCVHEALDCFDESLRLLREDANPETEISALNNKGNACIMLGDYSRAIDCLQEALKKVKKSNFLESMGIVWSNLGLAYLQKNDIGKALSFFRKAIHLSRRYNFERILWESHFGLAQCYEKQGKNVAALDHYLKSMEVIEAVRGRISLDVFKAGYARDKLMAFDGALNLLNKLNGAQPPASRIEEMFSIVERVKARAFLEGLGETGREKPESLSPAAETKKRQRETTREIASLILELSGEQLGAGSREDKILKLSCAEDKYINLISAKSSDHRNLRNSACAEPSPLSKLRQKFLDERTGVLEYFLGENRSYLFFITREETRLFELPSREKMEESLKGYLKMLTASDLKHFQGERAAERIAGELLFPLNRPAAGRLERLIIVPDGILYYLPFETLRIGDGPDSRRRYLIERYEVSYAPSSSSLVYLSQKRICRKRKKLLAFGRPFFGREREAQDQQIRTTRDIFGGTESNFDFSSLPYSRKEVQDIARHFPAESRDVFLDREASEKTVKKTALQDYRIVHFACHGLLDEAVPLRSALVLSPGGSAEEDGFLQVREIYDLKMDADLVVLSACQTGRGSLERAEGMMGLPRIFFFAGAKSVVSTLWPIRDRSTASLMNEFYDSISRGGGKAKALRLAKLKMLASRKYAHPFYWAAFVLNGDFGPVLEPGGH